MDSFEQVQVQSTLTGVWTPGFQVTSTERTDSGVEVVRLRRVSDGWEAERFLTSGRYRVAVKIDNGPWRSPGNLAKMKDEFGGQNGLIIIP